MIRRTPVSTRTDTRFPSTTLFRSGRPLASELPWLEVRAAQPGSVHQRPGQRCSAAPRSRAARLVGMPVDSVLTMRDVKEAGVRSRSEEHTSELQSLMRISYAVFCLKKNKTTYQYHIIIHKTL